jgi:hypothetical protein
MRRAVAAGASTRLHFPREKGAARLTSRTPLAPDRKRPGTAKSHAGQGGPVPPACRTATRNAVKATRKTGGAAQTPQIPAYGEENGPPAKRPDVPENGGQTAPPDAKSPETRKAEKAMAKTGRAAKKPQFPAFNVQNGPPAKKRQIPESGGQNSRPPCPCASQPPDRVHVYVYSYPPRDTLHATRRAPMICGCHGRPQKSHPFRTPSPLAT